MAKASLRKGALKTTPKVKSSRVLKKSPSTPTSKISPKSSPKKRTIVSKNSKKKAVKKVDKKVDVKKKTDKKVDKKVDKKADAKKEDLLFTIREINPKRFVKANFGRMEKKPRSFPDLYSMTSYMVEKYTVCPDNMCMILGVMVETEEGGRKIEYDFEKKKPKLPPPGNYFVTITLDNVPEEMKEKLDDHVSEIDVNLNQPDSPLIKFNPVKIYRKR